MSLIVPEMQKLYIEGWYARRLLSCLHIDIIDDFLTRAPDEAPRIAGIIQGVRQDIAMVAFSLTRCGTAGKHFLCFVNREDTRPVYDLPYGAKYRLEEFMRIREMTLVGETKHAKVAAS